MECQTPISLLVASAIVLELIVLTSDVVRKTIAGFSLLAVAGLLSRTSRKPRI
jgi:hypothetical protein